MKGQGADLAWQKQGYEYKMTWEASCMLYRTLEQTRFSLGLNFPTSDTVEYNDND